MPPLRIVFAGTPEFAVPALDALHAAGHRIVAVYTQPDRPAGRGRALSASPVKQRALQLGLPVEQPATLKSAAAQAPLAAYAPDVMVVVAYGLMLPQAVLDIPRLGCLNIHASLLPRWRGAAPIQRAIAGRRRAQRRLASCRWRPGSTPARCCCGGKSRIGAARDRRLAARPAGAARRRGHRRRAAGLGRGDAARRAAARGGRHLRRQAAQGRGAPRLVARRPSNSIGRCAPSIPGRSPTRRWQASRCASGSRSRCRVQRRRTWRRAPSSLRPTAGSSSLRATACSSCRHCSFRDASRSRPATC